MWPGCGQGCGRGSGRAWAGVWAGGLSQKPKDSILAASPCPPACGAHGGAVCKQPPAVQRKEAVLGKRSQGPPPHAQTHHPY